MNQLWNKSFLLLLCNCLRHIHMLKNGNLLLGAGMKTILHESVAMLNIHESMWKAFRSKIGVRSRQRRGLAEVAGLMNTNI